MIEPPATALPPAPVLSGPVLVVGTGLLGTSVGLALTRAGVEVWLADTFAEHVRTASQLGAGTAYPEEGVPGLVVVAVPPERIAEVAARALATGAVVTDVGSVKGLPLTELTDAVDEDALRRYVGGHPMAGSERSGPLAASAALFEGRPWAIVPHDGSAPGAVATVEALVQACRAAPVRYTPIEHDRAVARTSHLPHLLSVLTAGQLAGARSDQLVLSGQGVRDVTRIAGSEPGLWAQIIRANGAAVADLLIDVRTDLDALICAVQAPDADDLCAILAKGVSGTRAIPAKHGGPAVRLASVYVAVPDRPGSLARLFADCDAIGVNVEDVRIDHDPARLVGLLEVVVSEASVAGLRDGLRERGWTTQG